MTYQLLGMSDEWMAEELRARQADVEQFCRRRDAPALAGCVSVGERLRSRIAGLLARAPKALLAHLAAGAPSARAGQA